MANIKIKLRPSTVSAKEGTLYFQVIHNRVVRQVNTEYKLYPSEWDAVRSAVIPKSSDNPQRQAYLLAINVRVETDGKRLLLVIARLEREGLPYTADKVVECFREGYAMHGIAGYTLGLNERLRLIGKNRMADRYTSTVNSLMRYSKGCDVELGEVDGTLVQGYEQWLKERGLCRNTTSFYMRNLRSIYNHAVEDGLVVSSSPFKHVYTGIDKTVKRALPFEVIRQLKQMDLSHNPRMEFARDMFLFSFYTRGMSFIDMAQLTKRNLHRGLLTYRRQKTAQQLHIKWEALMEEIVEKYKPADSPYLLPLATGEGEDFCKQYRNSYRRITKLLKKIGEMMGLSIPLTTYVARHSWASIARSKNVPLAAISEALGHDSEKTTRIYLASLDSTVVDNANSLIINSL